MDLGKSESIFNINPSSLLLSHNTLETISIEDDPELSNRSIPLISPKIVLDLSFEFNDDSSEIDVSHNQEMLTFLSPIPINAQTPLHQYVTPTNYIFDVQTPSSKASSIQSSSILSLPNNVENQREMIITSSTTPAHTMNNISPNINDVTRFPLHPRNPIPFSVETPNHDKYQQIHLMQIMT